ncbi:hypothetical protein [Natronomonas amylolytica]|uniref:hypothetical protein n=1 Tax=Natronomonas amylolytica TaxID=3108498 RepID=UPI00300B0892
MRYRLLPFISGLVLGVVVGALLMQAMTPPLSGTSVPSHGLTTATGCADAEEPRAWVGHVPDADYRAVYLTNYTFVHDEPDIEIRAELTESDPGAWVLAVTTTPADGDKEIPEDCQPRTRLDASVALPTDAESLRITLDGEPVTEVETTANTTRFRYLDE